MMDGLFVVLSSHGPAWDTSLPLDDQVDWTAHAKFMDGLVDEGFVLLGGPLEGTGDAMLVLRARNEQQIAQRLDADPWRQSGLLVLKQISRWTLRLGSLG